MSRDDPHVEEACRVDREWRHCRTTLRTMYAIYWPGKMLRDVTTVVELQYALELRVFVDSPSAMRYVRYDSKRTSRCYGNDRDHSGKNMYRCWRQRWYDVGQYASLARSRELILKGRGKSIQGGYIQGRGWCQGHSWRRCRSLNVKLEYSKNIADFITSYDRARHVKRQLVSITTHQLDSLLWYGAEFSQ